MFLSSASAQQNVEEVVVTARKREQSLFDVPMMIDVLGRDQIEARGIATIDDIAKNSTSLVFDRVGFGNEDTRPVIRGLPATRGRPAIGILIDGIDVSSQGVYSVGGGQVLSEELFDIQRIEVVKGPQSALYGRVAFGGAINYVTSKPGNAFAAQVLADVGNHGKQKVSASVGGPIADGVGLLLKGAYSKHDGFYKNTITGARIGGRDDWGVSGALSWQIAAPLTLDVRVAYSENESGQAPISMLSAGNGTAFFQPAPANALGLTGAFAPAYGELKALRPVTYSVNPLDGSEMKGGAINTFFVSAISEYQATDNITLTSSTGYVNSDSSVDIDGDGIGAAPAFTPFPAPGGTAEALPRFRWTRIRTDLEQINQELRLGDLKSKGLRWAVGGLYWYEDRFEGDRDITTIFFAPANASAALNNRLTGAVAEDPNSRKTQHGSVYGLVEWDVTPRLTGSFEGRWSRESYDYLVTTVRLASGTAFAGPLRPATPATYVAHSSEEFFAPRFNVSYMLQDNLNLYATAAKGVKPGGYATFTATTSLDTKRYRPENVWNYELGAKGHWLDGRVNASAAIFRMDYTDKQTQSQEPDPASVFGLALLVKNAGQARINGFEGDLSIAPVTGVVLTGSYTYLDAEYTKFLFNSNGAQDVTLAGNCTPVTVAGTLLCQVDLSGNKMERTPKHSMSFTAAYRTPVFSPDIEFFALGAVQYRGERQLDYFNRYQIGEYTNVDLQFGLETDTWSLIAYADNLLDDKKIKSAQENFDIFTFNQSINLVMPDRRQLGVRAKWKF